MYDIKDSRGVPVSGGIPPIVRYAFIIGIILIFVIVGLVIFAANANHIWPSEASQKIPL